MKTLLCIEREPKHWRCSGLVNLMHLVFSVDGCKTDSRRTEETVVAVFCGPPPLFLYSPR